MSSSGVFIDRYLAENGSQKLDENGFLIGDWRYKKRHLESTYDIYLNFSQQVDTLRELQSFLNSSCDAHDSTDRTQEHVQRKFNDLNIKRGVQ